MAPPSSNLTTPGPSRPTSKGGRVHKGNALSWNELVSSERAKVAAMLSQVCVCVCVCLILAQVREREKERRRERESEREGVGGGGR